MRPADFSAEVFAAMSEAVRGLRLSPEDRWDVRQELAIRFLRTDASKIDDVAKWARSTAWRLAAHLNSDRARQRDLREELRTNGGRPYRRGPAWSPDWYPPCEKAEQYAPFACEGARVMHVKPSTVLPFVEAALIAMAEARKSKST